MHTESITKQEAQAELPTREEVAWAAGLFEGEGCFTAHMVQGRWWTIGAAVAMTDKDVLLRFARIVGVGYFDDTLPLKKRPAHHKPVHRWRVHDVIGVCHVIDLLLPYLCERRTNRALEVREIASQILPAHIACRQLKSHCKRGHALEGDNIMIEKRTGKTPARRCRTCRTEWNRKAAG